MIKVLIIDDNEDITYTVKTTLEDVDKDYKVLCANSGKEGLKMVSKNKPDLVLLDIMMPDISGWIVNKNIKMNKKTKDIPVVFLTAKTDQTSKEMGKCGGDDFITKPFDAIKVDSIIKKILERKKKDKTKEKKETRGK